MAKRVRLVPGTAKMQRYPGYGAGMAGLKGIEHYGYVSVKSQRALKVPMLNVAQLESIGYKLVGQGTSYAYITEKEWRPRRRANA